MPMSLIKKFTFGSKWPVGTMYKPDLPKRFRRSAGFISSGSGSSVFPWLHFMYTKLRTLGKSVIMCRRKSSGVHVRGSLEDDRRPPASSDLGTPVININQLNHLTKITER
jgi:hypothetical protein